MREQRRKLCVLLVAAALLAGCQGAGTPDPSAGQPPAATAPAQPEPTESPAEEAEVTEAPALPEPAGAPAEPAAPLALAQGQQVLRLAYGADAGQIGQGGAAAFRIGGDGTVRVLDAVNKRVLFLGQDGAQGRVQSLAEAQEPVDFIVNNDAEVFVFDQGQGSNPQVLRYGRGGELAARYPLAPGVAVNANGITLTSDQTLMLTWENSRVWTVLHRGVVVPPEVQPLTEQPGAASPRSPVLFETRAGSGAPTLWVVGLTSSIAGDMLGEVQRLDTPLPPEARFFNVDRAMNLYFLRQSDQDETADLWRVQPDGSVAGGAQIPLTGCGLRSWRSLYVDQPGAVWTMCAVEGGVAFTRYDLLDPAGAPLAAAPPQAAEVAWRPGANFSAA
ncbi:MAG TPA: hypothetical protein VFS21_18830 [Roseiflexaceae bacterium]|nr:hypothetical protein [Roseiflexaceae bacterium]